MKHIPTYIDTIHFPGRILVFLHAFPLHAGMWKPIYPLLHERTYPYLAINYPGFGGTPCFPYKPDMEDYARFVENILDDIGIRECILVGSSMGGYVAMACMRRFPERIAGVVLLHTKCEADPPEVKEKRFAFIQKIEEQKCVDPLIEPHLQGFLTSHTRKQKPALVNRIRSMMESASRKGVVHALSAMASRPSSEQTLKTWDKPVFILTGTKDPFAPPQAAQKMASLAPHSTLVLVQNTAHLSHYETLEPYKQDFIRFLEQFFKNA